MYNGTHSQLDLTLVAAAWNLILFTGNRDLIGCCSSLNIGLLYCMVTSGDLRGINSGIAQWWRMLGSQL